MSKYKTMINVTIMRIQNKKARVDIFFFKTKKTLLNGTKCFFFSFFFFFKIGFGGFFSLHPPTYTQISSSSISPSSKAGAGRDGSSSFLFSSSSSLSSVFIRSSNSIAFGTGSFNLICLLYSFPAAAK